MDRRLFLGLGLGVGAQGVLPSELGAAQQSASRAMGVKLCVAVVLAFASGILPASGNEQGETLLQRWCDGLVFHQLSFPDDGGLDGAMVCSA